MKRVLIGYPGSLGDLLLVRPVLLGLMKIKPDLVIDFAGNPLFLPLLAKEIHQWFDFNSAQFLPLFSTGDSFPASFVSFLRRYDLTIFWLGRSNSRNIVNPELRKQFSLFVASSVPPKSWQQHVSRWLVATLKPVFPDLNSAFILEIPPLDISDSLGKFSGQEDLLVIHPGSGSPQKNLPLSFHMELARQLKETMQTAPVFLVGPAESEYKKRLSDEGWPTFQPRNVLELASWLSKARLVVGHDSGVCHLSAQLGVATIVLFVSTDPRIWHPIGPKWQVVSCANIEPKNSRFLSLPKWTPEAIIAHVKKLLLKQAEP